MEEVFLIRKLKMALIQKYIKCKESNDSVTVEVTYEVLENIGTKEKIVF